MCHLWGGLRIRLRSHAACPETGHAFGQSRRLQKLASTEGHLVSGIREIRPFAKKGPKGRPNGLVDASLRLDKGFF